MAILQEVENVKSFLEQKHIVTSYDWVEACVNFVKQEHNQNITLQNLKNFVYQQWLTADLEEIGVPSLPSQLPTTQKITLNGCFVLQVDGIRDVGKPAYSQLKELERNVNTNAEFSAAPETTLAPWEAKPTRMLMLNLTDGCIRVQGMEYKQITTLSPNLPPGVKVQINGPVDCRFGILMLTSENIRVLGGEVESKLVQYSRKTILRDILQLPAEDENTEIIPEDSLLNTDSSISSSRSTIPISTNIPSTSSTFTSWSNNTTQQINGTVSETRQSTIPRSWNQRESQRTEVFNSSDARINSSRGPNSFPSVQNIIPPISQNGNDDLDAFEDEEDDFADGLDYTVLDEIEKETLNKSESFENPEDMQDVWLEDEDVVQDLMAFQDDDPGFQMPFEEHLEEPHSESLVSGTKQKESVSFLSSVLKNPEVDCTVTIKGFIIKVLSKLECTTDKGWSLMVKINDGTDSLDVVIHDKVIEGIIGISAPTMVKMQQNADTPEKRKEVAQAISKFKATLQDYNCLMDVKLTPGSTPCLIKCYPLDQLQQQQLLERIKSHS
ncbi:hypothetical protein JTE90_012932 [Oedothorax gibbosus]|uniref:RecQ-mediated genome instability protein 1 n=1 Tax=Oedothorax gibbosus TaxID=931172 RepID=A0AAV6UZS7_9ARAC|nr:hypothetical protein JTE90_012932 [Oedothorax gibbosus]